MAGAKKLKAFPADWSPQLATLIDEPFDSEDWIFEAKYDGYRALAHIQNGEPHLISRNAKSFDEKFKELLEPLAKFKDSLILDGEIVIQDNKGRDQFQWLQNHDQEHSKGELKYYIFDLLYFNGYDLRGLPLLTRKKILKGILPKLRNIHYSEHIVERGRDYFAKAEKNNLEGIIAKKASSKYYEGKRSKDWLKLKSTLQQEMVIGGYTSPQGSRTGIGAIICGYYQDGKLIYAGKVGSGFDEATLKTLEKKLKKLDRKTSPFKTEPKLKESHWVTPSLVAQIKFMEWTAEGSMRHPVFVGLKIDKDAKNVVLENNYFKPEFINEKSSNSSALKSDKVAFTNLDKLFWPKLQLTKGDVVSYYARIAKLILPFMIDRPQSLRRNPDGIKTDGFFQKNVAGLTPDWISTRKIKSKSNDESIEYLLCQDKDTLLFLANWGCIEMNPWTSRVGSINKPDYMVFDLDPVDATIEKLVTTALKVKEFLDKMQLKSYVKTSGGKGLHIYIPIKADYTYKQTQNICHILSQMVNRALPEITSLERSPSKRKGKIYLDYLQNAKGKTMATVYSARPRDHAGVSTPLDWEEVNDKLDLNSFNLKTIDQRLAEKGDLWADFFENRNDLKMAIAKL